MYNFRESPDHRNVTTPGVPDALTAMATARSAGPSTGSLRTNQRTIVDPGPVLEGGGGGVQRGDGDWKATLTPEEAWLLERESGFDPTARNPSSGAFGIWQGLGRTLTDQAAKMGVSPQTTDPWEQLAMFRNYVKERYGTQAKANAFWLSNNPHWY